MLLSKEQSILQPSIILSALMMTELRMQTFNTSLEQLPGSSKANKHYCLGSLSHLEGKVVNVIRDDFVLTDKTVASGADNS